MKNTSKDVLFLTTLSAIIAIGIGLTYINKSKESEPSANSSTSAYKQPIAATSNTSDAINYQHFAMTEPFAAKAPFEFTPAAWMQMMSNMMNTMQMTQMMHQMATLPTQMMNPAMWSNPHAMLPHGVTNPSQQPMDPKEYKKWYEQQIERQQSTK